MNCLGSAAGLRALTPRPVSRQSGHWGAPRPAAPALSPGCSSRSPDALVSAVLVSKAAPTPVCLFTYVPNGSSRR